MKLQIGLSLAVLISLVLGIAYKQDPYSIREIGRAGDQLPLQHRDSPYSHISWIVSECDNYAQLRFMDRIEGAVCLQPNWDSYAELAKENPNLAHLVPDSPWTARAEPGKKWPKGKPHPSPGTLTNTKYVCMFPSAVLLNRRVMEEAQGDPRKAKPNIIIVGLGSAVGISVLAHHFPEASIKVVDIDQVVIDMVYDHYPFIEWLSKQKCSDGRPRLEIAGNDARQYIHYPKMRNDNGMTYDIVILDAYTSGSTIPSHLMTAEFFKQVRDVLHPDGILLSNIIGSYTGPKNLVLGGAIRSQQEAGFTHIHNFPVLSSPLMGNAESRELMEIKPNHARNNMVLACAEPVDPIGHRQGWEYLKSFTLYNDLPAGMALTEKIELVTKSNSQWASTSVSVPPIDAARKLRIESRKASAEEMKGQKTLARYDDYSNYLVKDEALVEECVLGVKEQWGKNLPTGWDRKPNDVVIYYQRYDWVLFARRTFERSVAAAKNRNQVGFKHTGKNIVGTDKESRELSLIPNAPLFTDSKPNADIYNR